MKDLLPHYEAELALLRRLSRSFAERYPGIAGNLQMSGDTCKDPHVERLIQASALLAARVSKRLDDDYPMFTESLLEMLYPHYLRSFPACSIVQLDFRRDTRELPEIVTVVPRGTILKSAPVRGVKCKFTTTSDIVVAPIRLAEARYIPILNAPASIRLSADASSTIALTFESAGKAALDILSFEQIRLFIDADPTLCAALHDTLFMRVGSAYISFVDEGAWTEISKPCISTVGYSEDQALIPFSARSHPAYRLLTEYFAFPEKFNFFDLAWSGIVRSMPTGCRRFTLHLVVKNAQNGCCLAQTLSKLSERNLLLNCAPVVNLFKRTAAPVDVRHTTVDYALLADSANPDAYEIFGIQSASLITDVSRRDGIQSVRPFYSMRHGQQAACYWIMRRDGITADISPGHEMRISLVDTDMAPLAEKAQTLSVELLCSNRHLPESLNYGSPDGDLTLDGTLTRTPVRLLRRPSAVRRFESGNGAHWRLISHLTLNHRSLSSVGLNEFREMLTLYNLPRSTITLRQIQGVTDLQYRTATTWVRGVPTASLMPGIEIRMTLDEEAFVGSSIYAFARTLDHFFGLYCQINVFSQLIVISNRSGEELVRCPPRSGAVLLD
ncbi:type VI secretion system baseplate subunit TssF [Duganella violaceipulchra]|uniref:Type VI secretion system baseplate subunit TssF n=1 Tax=Duganella violaceipulchra TaxID=2849652 RepID=A0AA41KZG7_9BURK|nr:type VI secretion system baseplate subunit TssF [Duganella violaceicalia]MBV6320456.1 type VI secretion system baseplate subunit TssF [Duganella violaceicalia]MCP2012291.1 type VI secretion system protein ImpG [Duganella violaceicalia]